MTSSFHHVAEIVVVSLARFAAPILSLMPKATRQEVYAAIDTERAYQDVRWNHETTTSGGFHSLEEWLVYIDDYSDEAKHLLSRMPRQDSDKQALEIMRKIAAMAVCAMEQHGAPRRAHNMAHGEWEP